MLKRNLKILLNMSKSKINLIAIITLVILICYLVYITGGIQHSYAHLIYIPIIISTFIFGTKAGVAIAIFSGMLLGHFMPINVELGIMQPISNWLIRIGFFITVSIVTGTLVDQIRIDMDMFKKYSYETVLTGLPNLRKLKLDLNRMVNGKEQTEFSLAVLKVQNMDSINRYRNYEFGEKLIMGFKDSLTSSFGNQNVYHILNERFIVIIPSSNIGDARLKIETFFKNYSQPIYIDLLPISVELKSGIVNYPKHATDANDLHQKLGMTLGEAEISKDNICIYDIRKTNNSKDNYDIIVALYDAIKNNKFKLVYQPKINIITKEIIGVEALIRWSDDVKGNINTETFIKIAEQAGLINEITKWVIVNVINQLKEWEKKGIELKIAINVSSHDLKDDSIIEFTRNYISLNNIEPELLEFEITETSIIENAEVAEKLLNSIKRLGMQISLDDFGTGYNSMINLARLPLNNIKIDRSFIWNLHLAEYYKITKILIDSMHYLGKKVIAEGVETEEQLNILKSMNCDIVQGYYYSKPLNPNDLVNYISNYE